MSQQRSTLVRLAPFTGVVFVALAVVGGLLAFGRVGWMAPSEEIAAHYTDNSGNVWTGTSMLMVSAVFLLWFMGSLWRRMRAAEASPARLSVVLFGGGAAMAAVLLVAAAMGMAGAASVTERGSVSADYAALTYDLATLLFSVAAAIALATVLLSFAVLAVRTRTHPGWWAWVTGLLGVGLLIVPVSWIAMFGGMAWILVMSVWLGMEGWRAAG